MCAVGEEMEEKDLRCGPCDGLGDHYIDDGRAMGMGGGRLAGCGGLGKKKLACEGARR